MHVHGFLGDIIYQSDVLLTQREGNCSNLIQKVSAHKAMHPDVLNDVYIAC